MYYTERKDDSMITAAEQLAQLAEELGCRVYRNEPLCEHTTFKIGGPCTVMIAPDSVEDLSKLVRFSTEKKIRTLTMGKGSNMLCADEGFNGVVFLFDNSLGEIEQIDDVTLRAFSGASLISVCRKALELSLSGLEFAYGIPGTVGGGVYMNAGAYQGEIKNVVKSVTAMDTHGNLRTYRPSQIGFTYRGSRFCYSNEMIISADFELAKGSKQDIEGKMKELIGRRKEKQPLEFPNAGSTFKRPEGQFAGKLIEDCGLRGCTVGGAQVSEKHCGFVINRGGATCSDVRGLIDHIQRTVRDTTGFNLECEVRIIPYE